MIREKFSMKNNNFHSRKFTDRYYAITPAGAFQIGLWNDIENYIHSLAIPVDIIVTDAFMGAFRPADERIEIATIPGFTYFDYQEDTIKEFIKHGRGISLLAPGAGKTCLTAGLCKSYLNKFPDFKILIIVPNTHLLNQTYDAFINEFGLTSVTMWGDKNTPDLSKSILIANMQMLTSDIPATLKIVKDYDIVVVDEVHRIGDKKTQIAKVVHNIVTPRKFGLSGTLPDEIMDVWNVIGKIGPILYEKTSYEIQKKGATTEIQVNVILCNHTNPPVFNATSGNPTDIYNQELEYVATCDNRNNTIVKIVNSLTGNILIMVDRIDYGVELYNKLATSDKIVFFIQGSTSTADRKHIIDIMENTSGNVCIAMSSIFSTGVSVKNLHYAIFTYIGKSSVKIVQSIGRTVRKHETKDKAIVFDISDNLKYSKKHLLERIAIYKKQKIDYTITNIKI